MRHCGARIGIADQTRGPLPSSACRNAVWMLVTSAHYAELTAARVQPLKLPADKSSASLFQLPVGTALLSVRWSLAPRISVFVLP